MPSQRAVGCIARFDARPWLRPGRRAISSAREDQIESEATIFIDQLHKVYDDFGFKDISYKLATRPANRIGSDEMWDKAEGALASALDAHKLPWQEKPGEGAFYGPKIEFTLKDSIGRHWQCGTLQVDPSMPGRLDAHYIAR